MKNNKNIITVAIILVCVSAVLIVKYFKDTSNAAKLKMSQAKVKGNENAPIKITEFIDFQCPACANGDKLLKKYMEQHPQLIRLELKHFPLKMHKFGQVASKYAECAGQQDKFWPYEELIVNRQDQWKVLFDAQPAFEQFVKEVGLNVNQMQACLKDPKVDEVIEKNKEEGKSLGVSSTPTYFINSVMVVGTKNLEFELNKLISAQTTK